MYNYSQIEKIRIKNFRNLGDVELDFKDSPIITLVGNNEAGKTSVVKAFSACALHANPREQKDWIRDTTKMFGIQIDLMDKTQIVRVKEDAGINMYKITYPDGRVWDINKIAEGLPVQVQQIMGLIAEEETGEFLHIRTYEDKLLFVVTPDSVNYKVMYNALKVEQLTKAIKTGSNEVNNLKSEVTRNENSLDTLRDQLSDINILDIDDLVNIRERLKYQLSLLDKIERAMYLLNNIKEYEASLGPIALIDRFNLKSVDEILAYNLMNINKSLNNRLSLRNSELMLKDAETLEDINIDIVNKLWNLMCKKNILSHKITEAGALIHLNEINEVNEALLVQMIKLGQLINRNSQLNKELNIIDAVECEEVTDNKIKVLDNLIEISSMYKDINNKSNDLQKINKYIEDVQEYLKQLGVAVESCPKCGEAVVFDLDKVQ